MPKIERLQQNTPEWHRWRKQGLGASDAPVIMGDAAFKTPRTLWSRTLVGHLISSTVAPSKLSPSSDACIHSRSSCTRQSGSIWMPTSRS